MLAPVQGLRILDNACNNFLEDPDKPLLVWESADKCVLLTLAVPCVQAAAMHSRM